MHPIVNSILNKYGDKPPQVITNQKFNEALKEIGEKAKLGRISIGGKVVEKKICSQPTQREDLLPQTPTCQNLFMKSWIALVINQNRVS